MEFSELTPEEKLWRAIFGSSSRHELLGHFLSDEEGKTVNDLLVEIAATSPNDTSKAWHIPPTSKALCERGVKILRLRFGFVPRTESEGPGYHGANTRTLDEVKVYFGVTRERIRQIENRMLRILRHPRYSRKLKSYLEGGQENE